MVFELVITLFRELSQIHIILLMAVFLVFIAFAYKAFQVLIKGFMVGVISASFPVIATLLGLDVPLTINNIVWFAILGVSSFLLYHTMSGGVRMMRLIYRPFGRMFRKKTPVVQKIIIRERESSSSSS